MLREERIFYDRSYLKDKGIKLAYTDKLSKIPVRFDGAGLLESPHEDLFELVLGIIQKNGHQHLSYDSIIPMKYEDYRLMEYHFNYFMNTKSIFDLIGHLLNSILKLGIAAGPKIDLSNATFTDRIFHKNQRIGRIIRKSQQWIIAITELRKALEHRKIVPILFIRKGELTSVPHFSKTPLSFTEFVNETKERKGIPDTEGVIAYMDKSIELTKNIVEESFALAVSILSQT
jgi:hypothetical protein